MPAQGSWSALSAVMLETSECCVCTGRTGLAPPPLMPPPWQLPPWPGERWCSAGGIVAARTANYKTPVAASDGDRALGTAGQDADGGQVSQLPAVGDRGGAWVAEGAVVEAEPCPSEQSRKGLSNSQVLSEEEEEEEGEDSDVLNSDLYSLEEINDLLDDTFGKFGKIKGYFRTQIHVWDLLQFCRSCLDL